MSSNRNIRITFTKFIVDLHVKFEVLVTVDSTIVVSQLTIDLWKHRDTIISIYLFVGCEFRNDSLVLVVASTHVCKRIRFDNVLISKRNRLFNLVFGLVNFILNILILTLDFILINAFLVLDLKIILLHKLIKQRFLFHVIVCKVGYIVSHVVVPLSFLSIDQSFEDWVHHI
jgi:hypothetical protein